MCRGFLPPNFNAQESSESNGGRDDETEEAKLQNKKDKKNALQKKPATQTKHTPIKDTDKDKRGTDSESDGKDVVRKRPASAQSEGTNTGEPECQLAGKQVA